MNKCFVAPSLNFFLPAQGAGAVLALAPKCQAESPLELTGWAMFAQ